MAALQVSSDVNRLCVTAKYRTLSNKVLNQLIVLRIHIVIPASQPTKNCLSSVFILQFPMQADGAFQVIVLPCLITTCFERQVHLSNSPRAYVITVSRSSAILVFASRAICRYRCNTSLCRARQCLSTCCDNCTLLLRHHRQAVLVSYESAVQGSRCTSLHLQASELRTTDHARFFGCLFL